MVKLFSWLRRQRSNEARDQEDAARAETADSRPSETKKIWSSIKTGITGETDSDRQAIEQAKAEAAELRRKLKAEKRQEQLQRKISAIKEAPLHEDELRAKRTAAIKQKAGTALRGLYTGISEFGAQNAPKQQAKPAQSQQPMPGYNPFSAFNMGSGSGMGFGGNPWGAAPAKSRSKRPKKNQKQPDMWAMLK